MFPMYFTHSVPLHIDGAFRHYSSYTALDPDLPNVRTISAVVIYFASTSSKFCHPTKLHLTHPTGPVSAGDDLCHFRWPYQANITLAFISTSRINLYSSSTCTPSFSINPSLKRLQKFSLRSTSKNLMLIGDAELESSSAITARRSARRWSRNGRAANWWQRQNLAQSVG
jgi:hypothetical protein